MDVVYSGQEHGKSEITLDEVRKTLGLPDSEKLYSPNKSSRWRWR